MTDSTPLTTPADQPYDATVAAVVNTATTQLISGRNQCGEGYQVDNDRLMEIIAKLKLGLSNAEVAAIFKLSEATIAKIQTEAVSNGLLRTSRLSHEDRRELRKQIAEWVKANNATLPEAAKQFKTSGMTVSRACAEFGVAVNQEARPHHAGVSQLRVLAMLIDGIPPGEVAENLGVTRQYISDCALKARKAGVFDAVDRQVQKGEKIGAAAAKKVVAKAKK